MPADPGKSVADYRTIAAKYDHATRLINAHFDTINNENKYVNQYAANYSP